MKALGKTNQTTQMISVHSEANEASPAICQIADQNQIQIISRSPQFTAIQLADGRRGFIKSHLLSFPAKIMQLKQDKVPVYQWASMTSPIKMNLPKNVLIECIGDELGAEGLQWLPIRTPHGQTGYVESHVKMSPMSRFHWMKRIPGYHFANITMGACAFLGGLVITIGSFFVLYTQGATIVFYFPIYMMIWGFLQLLYGLIQLRRAIETERRRDRDRRRDAARITR